MRVVVIGAGAVGGVVAARLQQNGHEVAVVARGKHGSVIAQQGLRLIAAGEDVTIPLTVYPGVEQVDWRADDVAMIGVKSQDTVGVLDAIVASGATVPIVCLQNGVHNEREALRRFGEVYAVCVMLPATHLEPGVVVAQSSPVTGLLDVGRYPRGTDRAEELVAAFRGSTFDSYCREDVMRWKYRKLLMNLANALEAALGPDGDRFGAFAAAVRAEATTVLEAAGIDVATPEEDRERRGSIMAFEPIPGYERPGGSTWQSLKRGAGSIEVDFLNGEIVLLGRLHSVATPLNSALCRVAHTMVAQGAAPGTVSPKELARELGLK